MSGTASEIDAGFFQMIHQIVNNREEEPDEERREDRRLSFDTTQQIAPWDGARFPAASEFFQVRCHDLTGNGLSFFLPAEPDFRSLVVQFGTQPNSLLAAAEIQRTSRVLVSPSGHRTRRRESQGGWPLGRLEGAGRVPTHPPSVPLRHPVVARPETFADAAIRPWLPPAGRGW